MYAGYVPLLAALPPASASGKMQYLNAPVNHNVIQTTPVAKITQNFLGNIAELEGLPESSMNNDTMHMILYEQVSQFYV